MLEAVGTGGCQWAAFRANPATAQTHHVLRDKHVEIQAVLADTGRCGRPDPWLPAVGPADTDGLTSRRINHGDLPMSLPAQHQ